MTPAQRFHQLGPARQRHAHLLLCEHALEVWRQYAAAHAPIRYADSVVGMRHEVDVDLPADALRSVRDGTDVADVRQRYQEPIAALQDDDLTFPPAVKFAYYAIYNCFEKHAGGEGIDPWVIVNQALSSQEDSGQWVRLLEEAIQEAVAAGEARTGSIDYPPRHDDPAGTTR